MSNALFFKAPYGQLQTHLHLINLRRKNGVGKKKMDSGNNCGQTFVKSQRLVKNLSSVAVSLKVVAHNVNVTRCYKSFLHWFV